MKSAIYILAGILLSTSCINPQEPIIAQERGMHWQRWDTTFDGCRVAYFWESKGEDSRTDTCCLDSIVFDDYGYSNYEVTFIYDSISHKNRVIDVIVTEIIPERIK